MTESEAIKEFEQNIQLPFGSSISDQASKMAIKALEKQERIKSIITDKKKQYRQGWEEIEQILRSDEQ